MRIVDTHQPETLLRFVAKRKGLSKVKVALDRRFLFGQDRWLMRIDDSYRRPAED